MRTLEILLILINLPALLAGLFPFHPENRRSLVLSTLAVLGAAAGGLHLVLDGYRWQMAPVYLLTAVQVLNLLRRARRAHQARHPGRIGRLAGSLGGLILLASGAALGALFPVPQIPPLTGTYPVGTTTLHLVDPDRPELYTEDPEDRRELMVQVWYPAAPLAAAESGPWMAEAAVAGPAIARRLNLPAFLLDHLQLVRTHAVVDAPLVSAPGPFPVLLFSHGWGGIRTQNISQVEELASQGFIVVAADHTYGAVVTVFPGDRVALWQQDILPAGVSQAAYDTASNQLVKVWAADLAFILNQLQGGNTEGTAGIFAGWLDMDKVGVIGHSTGGGAAVEWCAQDARCRAGFTMDAWLEPVSATVIDAGLDQPFLFMRSEAWEQPARNPRNDRLQAELLDHLNGPGYRLVVQGTAHYDFSSLPLFSPLAPALGLKGPIPGSRINDIVNEYARAFFHRHLLGGDDPLLDGPADVYPEVRFN